MRLHGWSDNDLRFYQKSMQTNFSQNINDNDNLKGKIVICKEL